MHRSRVLLAGEGYEVRTASDATEALDILQAFRPGLILLDIQLPGIDGLELTRRLKAQPSTRDIPILGLTAYAMKGDEERILAAGCDGYIPKPIRSEEHTSELQSPCKLVCRLLLEQKKLVQNRQDI